MFLREFYKIKLLVIYCVKVGGNGLYSEGSYPNTVLIKNLKVVEHLNVVFFRKKCRSIGTVIVQFKKNDIKLRLI